MIRSTQISRLDGLVLAASVDPEEQSGEDLSDIKNKVKQLSRKMNRNSADQGAIESDRFNIFYIIQESLVFLCICDMSYPRKLAFTYLADLASEFTSLYPAQQYLAPSCRPYAYVEFDSFIQKTKKTYQDSRATQNLDKLNDELKDVTQVMTKNIEDLLYRGDSLEKMGEMSGRLREDSRKYKKAAHRMNWELLLKMVRSPLFTAIACFFFISCVMYYYMASRINAGLWMVYNSTVRSRVWSSSSSYSYGGDSYKTFDEIVQIAAADPECLHKTLENCLELPQFVALKEQLKRLGIVLAFR